MPQRLPGPCPLPPGHPTGEPRYYSAGCRCADSRRAAAEYSARNRRAIAYGRRSPNLVADAAPSQEILRRLTEDHDIKIRRIGAATGLSESILYRVLNGEQTTVRENTAARIAAYTPAPGDELYHNTVSALGAARRLQALAAIGWSAREVAARTEAICARPVTDSVTKGVRAGRHERIYLFAHQAIVAAYDELWDQRPPADTQQRRAAITRSLRTAEREGWAPPMAWDDAGLDDPGYTPDASAVRVATGGASLDTLVELLDAGEEISAATHRAGYSHPDSAKRALHRAGYSLLSWPQLVPPPAVISRAA